MAQTQICGVVGRILSNRSGLTEDFFKELEELEKRAKEIKTTLLDLAPVELRDFILEEEIFEILFKWGRSQFDIVYDRDHFGCYEVVVKDMASLAKAWEGAVSIVVGENPEPHRVQVTFTAIM